MEILYLFLVIMTSGLPISLRELTNSVIDYAGMFPPANLSLENAFKNYLCYLNDDFSSILTKFICPASSLPGLTQLLNNDPEKNIKLRLSVLGKGGNSVDDFNLSIANDLKFWTDFLSESQRKASADFFEVKLPGEILKLKSKEQSLLLDLNSKRIDMIIKGPSFKFYEISHGDDPGKEIDSAIDAIGIHNLGLTNPDSGFKLRTGGVTPESVPTSELIVHCIRKCLDRKVPVKFTAGLHHAFRNFDNQVGTKMHGFLNVFCAGVIAVRHNISDSGMNELINDEDPGNFVFTNEYFSWKDWKVNNREIIFARENLMTTFGSCSYTEPADDLKNFSRSN